MTAFASFLEKLHAIPDGDGTLLDHSLFLYGAGMSNSNLHYMYDLPALVVAGREFGIRGGRHLLYGDTPRANLHLTLLDKLGLQIERFGDSNGRLELLADV